MPLPILRHPQSRLSVNESTKLSCACRWGPHEEKTIGLQNDRVDEVTLRAFGNHLLDHGADQFQGLGRIVLKLSRASQMILSPSLRARVGGFLHDEFEPPRCRFVKSLGFFQRAFFAPFHSCPSKVETTLG